MRFGLRTEIILSVSLLLAAAILFAGFLLLKLTERNLLDQQRLHATNIINLLTAGIEAKRSHQPTGFASPRLVPDHYRFQEILAKQPDIIAWRLLDTRLTTLASMESETERPFVTLAPNALERDEVYEQLDYETFRLFNPRQTINSLDLSVPLWAKNEPYGLLQVRFGLDELQDRVLGAQKVVLVYVLVYGLVLAVFAVYLMNRNIVKPVRQLHRATRSVAEGSLARVKMSSGPGEIHDLADSFNHMVKALANSRIETEEHISSLERSNNALERARDDLVRSEKLATVGHLAAGMAHEIGNPLGAVIGYLNILKEDAPDELRELVERSLNETQRIDRLVRELLDYSAPVDKQNQAFCPVTLLRETVEMLRHQGQLDSVDIEDHCSNIDNLVNVDRGRLMQVWINLLLNARDAMGGHGRLVMSSEGDQECIRIVLCDDGPGIEPDIVKRIFEPFFTTKDPGKGYGLGLAVCQRILDESGGSISVQSEKGQGTCFTVELRRLLEP